MLRYYWQSNCLVVPAKPSIPLLGALQTASVSFAAEPGQFLNVRLLLHRRHHWQIVRRWVIEDSARELKLYVAKNQKGKLVLNLDLGE